MKYTFCIAAILIVALSLVVVQQGAAQGFSVQKPFQRITQPTARIPLRISAQSSDEQSDVQPLARFQRFSLAQGLSQASALALVQDRQGFLWIGTQDGLNRFDGYTFTVFKHNERDSTSLADNYVQALHETRSGTLWVGTERGLQRFDRAKERFAFYTVSSYTVSSEQRTGTATTPSAANSTERAANELATTNINALAEDPLGVLWVGTDKGLYALQERTGAVTRLTTQTAPQLPSDVINALHVAQDGIVWIGTAQGLATLNTRTNVMRRYDALARPSALPSALRPTTAEPSEVSAFCDDGNGTLWIGTSTGLWAYNHRDSLLSVVALPASLASHDIRSLQRTRGAAFPESLLMATLGGGVAVMNLRTRNLFTITANPTDPNSLSNNQAITILEDRAGVVWVGTWSGGLNRLDTFAERFRRFAHNPTNPRSLSNTNVRAVYEDRSGTLYAGTISGGLNLWQQAAQARQRDGLAALRAERWNALKHSPTDPSSLSDNEIRAVLEDKQGRVWVGTSNGLNLWNAATKRWTRLQHNAADSTSLSHNQVRGLLQDQTGMMWVTTYGGGVNRLNPATMKCERFQHHPQRPQSLSHNTTWTVYEDRSGTLWIGTIGGGLNKFNPHTASFTAYRHDPQNPQSLSSDRITFLHEDRKGRFWVATQGGGLDEFDRASGTFRHFTERDGLPSNAIGGVLEDDKGNLWLSTIRGVTKFMPDARTCRNYEASDGLNNANFYIGSAHKTRDGLMLFGAADGLTAFYPDSVRDDPYIPPVVLTAFKKFNKNVVLDTAITLLKTLQLSYNDAVITFEFAALSFAGTEHNRYQYTLEGFDTQWIDGGTKREATYTNLDAGTYTFRVRGSNHDGVWNMEGVALTLIITPPWWETWWFRALAMLCSTTLALVAYKLRTRRIKRRNQELERLVGERTAELQEANEQIQRQLETLETQAQEIEITNTELHESNIQLQRAYNNINVLSRVGQKVTATLDWDTIFSELYEGINVLMDAPVFAVGLYDAQKQNLEMMFMIENTERLSTHVFSMTDTSKFSVLCALRREEIVLNDVDAEYHRYVLQRPASVRGRMVHSLVYLPLCIDGRLVGVMTVQSYNKHSFAAHHLDILRAFAPYLASALENAHAYEEIHRQMEILDAQAVEIELTNTELQHKNLLLEQLNAEKNEFLGIVAHDLKNPLNGIMMSASLVEKYWQQLTLADITDRLQSIQRSAKRMTDIIMQLLDINAIETGSMHLKTEEFDLVPLLQTLAHEYTDRAAAKNIRLHVQTADASAHIFADSNAVMEVLENLISNAIKYSPAERSVWVSVSAVLPVAEQPQGLDMAVIVTAPVLDVDLDGLGLAPVGAGVADVSHTRTGEQPPHQVPQNVQASCSHLPVASVRVVVRDEGPGLSSDDKAKLFGKFARLSARPTGGESSTGLGLSIVKRMVETMNGVVWCESTLGEGAIFAVEFPAVS
jgi:signal transduction histidine kinase/ligand-binding sensor domain-containing protein